MDMNPEIKKYKSKTPKKMCETCLFKRGDFFEDPEDKDIIRVYCKARYTNVNTDQMTKWCDFYTLKPKTE